jgi:hypothetical protein
MLTLDRSGFLLKGKGERGGKRRKEEARRGKRKEETKRRK